MRKEQSKLLAIGSLLFGIVLVYFGITNLANDNLEFVSEVLPEAAMNQYSLSMTILVGAGVACITFAGWDLLREKLKSKKAAEQ